MGFHTHNPTYPVLVTPRLLAQWGVGGPAPHPHQHRGLKAPLLVGLGGPYQPPGLHAHTHTLSRGEPSGQVTEIIFLWIF